MQGIQDQKPRESLRDEAREREALTKESLLGLQEEEYRRICQRLGREPNRLELGMFAGLWSEHCAYKHSRPLFKRFPTESEHLLVGPGENAGVVDVGDGAVAFRIESHNHPTAIEPYHGAATGAGGIIRDILAVGARPVALLVSLRFGLPEDEKSQRLLKGALAGLRDYGNRVGVPPVGGETVFEACYRDNPLVNVLAVGYLPKERLVRARASGVGNALILVGGTTGRDGILGASFASDALSSEQEPGTPAAGAEPGAGKGPEQPAEPGGPPVQVGDPDVEKRLIEACLEILEQPGVVGIQDVGAAGIT